MNIQLKTTYGVSEIDCFCTLQDMLDGEEYEIVEQVFSKCEDGLYKLQAWCNFK